MLNNKNIFSLYKSSSSAKVFLLSFVLEQKGMIMNYEKLNKKIEPTNGIVNVSVAFVWSDTN